MRRGARWILELLLLWAMFAPIPLPLGGGVRAEERPALETSVLAGVFGTGSDADPDLSVEVRAQWVQVFSPGALAKPHSAIDSIRQCSECHSGQQKLEAKKCLSCHELIGQKSRTRKGYHGQNSVRAQSCEKCHTDHKGVDAAIIEWPGGRKDRFPHAQTGWTLKGKHAETDCKKCHDSRLIQQEEVSAYVKKHAKKESYLGLGTDCTDCHVDEHRGKLEGTCESCHDERAWKPAPGFDHDKFWKLNGKHKKADCVKCHEEQPDARYSASAFPKAKKSTFLSFEKQPHEKCTDCHFDEHRGTLKGSCESCHSENNWKPAPGFKHDAFWKLLGAHRSVDCGECHPSIPDPKKYTDPKPKHQSYLKLKPIEHETCTSCHTDPHKGKFGADCLSCHTMDSWRTSDKQRSTPDALAFHDKTSFPLLGAHQTTACDTCHPKDKKGKKLLKPIPHAECEACHATAHPELEKDPTRKPQDCKACHTEEAFAPSSFTETSHERTRYPLTGAHLAVGCEECHTVALEPLLPPQKPRRVPDKLAQQRDSSWGLRARSSLSSTAHGADAALKECQSCHASPHRQQFAQKACTECHQTTTWMLEKAFKHEKTSYPLTGKHQEVACDGCHLKEQDASGSFVRYAPIPAESCEQCHRDTHAGQFTQLLPAMACEQCHDTADFKQERFEHNQTLADGSPFSSFPLEGKHMEAECKSCHPQLALKGLGPVTRYRPTPEACESCHADVHAGAYRAGAQLVRQYEDAAQSAASSALKSAQSGKSGAQGTRAGEQAGSRLGGWSAPAHWSAAGDEPRTDCAACHSARSWQKVSFDHSRTEFPLRGQHQEVRCEACHTAQRGTQVPTDCAGCHENIHQDAGDFQCQECHTEQTFRRSILPIAKHTQTAFPLLGRHAATACTECHMDVRSVSFSQAPSDCFACHEKALASVPATALDHTALSSNCGQCHAPLSWKNGSYRLHDQCFPISPRSEHFRFSCETCHTQGIPSPNATCSDSGVSCVSCHGCEEGEHQSVLGYECADRKCYQCHPGGNG